MALYYIARPGTSMRACDKAGDVLRADEAGVEAACVYFEHLLPMRELGQVSPILVEDWYVKWRLPELRASKAMERLAADAPNAHGVICDVG